MMRHGFTTGSCAAAAAKAAAWMLLSGTEKETISIITPKGVTFDAQILEIRREKDAVSCAVRKDGGDDPDVTTGSLVYAAVSLNEAPVITIDGGEGIGRVTRPGLDQPVGNAAINSVPRRMIEEEVRQVLELFDHKGGADIVISIPDGVELAKKTFNPNLGIVGGISVLGTSGVVEPMSQAALIATIRAEMSVRKAEGQKKIAMTFGNYGRDYMNAAYAFDIEKSVKCSNFVGEAIRIAIEMGFEEMLITGHSGKLVKVAGGIMNTHSKEADCRMELIAAAAVETDVEPDLIKQILGCLSTEEAFRLLKQGGHLEKVTKRLTERIKYHLDRIAAERINLECIMYANEFGLLGASEGAFRLLEEIKSEM